MRKIKLTDGEVFLVAHALDALFDACASENRCTENPDIREGNLETMNACSKLRLKLHSD